MSRNGKYDAYFMEMAVRGLKYLTPEQRQEAMRKAEEETKPKATPVDSFHAHLEACSQCMNRPFDLCPEGMVLLRDTAKAP